MGTSPRVGARKRSACGWFIPTQNILLSLWGDDDFFNARSLQVLITRLRIINVRGTGLQTDS